jgi:hypothetical protein
VLRVRVARPTDRLDEVVRFYRDGLGLLELGRFEGHHGADPDGWRVVIDWGLAEE